MCVVPASWQTTFLRSVAAGVRVDTSRNSNETLVLGQNAFLPEAQGIVRDVRDLSNIAPLDYGSEIKTL